MLTKICDGFWLDLSLVEWFFIYKKDCFYYLKGHIELYNCSSETGKILEDKINRFMGILE